MVECGDRSRARKEMSDWSRKRSSPLAFAVDIYTGSAVPSPMIFSLSKNRMEKIRKEKNWIYINEMLEIEQVGEGQVSL